MTQSHHGQNLALVLISCFFLGGCAGSSTQKFTLSFLPPAPHQSSPSAADDDAPSVPVNKYVANNPVFVPASFDLPPRPSRVDMQIRRADERFDRGRRLYQEGDAAGARAEFDAAIDLLLSAPSQASDRFKIEARLEQMVAAIHKFDVNRLGAGDFSDKPSYDKAPLEDILEMTFPVDPTLKPKVKEQLTATTSQLPLELNDAVLSYINYFSGERGRRTLLSGYKRSGRYRELITRILAEERVPQELIYLAQAESGFLPRAVSHRAAVGMWQFVQARGRQYGLTQTKYTDDRLDPEKATRSAARHLRDLYEKFGDWYLALAAYNCGDGCVERAVQRTGYADFWELRRRNAIPKETANYVPIIVAMTIIHKNAAEYGLDEVEPEPAVQYDTVELSSPTHVALIADAADRPVSEVRELNPALLATVAPAGFEMRVPPGTRTQVLAGLETIPPERRASWRIYRVAPGDTMESIARRYNMPASNIATANRSSDAEVGDVLIIPTKTQLEKASSKRTSTKKIASKKKSTGVHSAKSSKSPSRSKTPQRRASLRGVQAASLR